MALTFADSRDPWMLHFTHIDNLRGVALSGLRAHSVQPDGVVECADQAIKLRRKRMAVPITPGGVVADYVPFYFAPRSPMLYKIWCGNVRGYEQGQMPLVYLVTRLSRVQGAGLEWVASNLNAAVATAEFINDHRRLAAHVDWKLMAERHWKDTPEDPSRKQRRMAEALVHRQVPWPVFDAIAVRHESVADQVKQVINGLEHIPGVVVRPRWYY